MVIWETHTSDTTGMTQLASNSTNNDWRQHRQATTSLKGDNLLSWILFQIQFQQLLTGNQILQETFMTPSDKLLHIIHWVKQWATVITQHRSIMDFYYIHFLFRESPGYFYTHYHMLWSGKVPGTASGLVGWPSDKPPELYQAKQPGWLTCWPMTGQTHGRGAGSWWWVWAFCSLTVNLWARPLSSGLFVGGADGVSDCREGLEQRAKKTEI